MKIKEGEFPKELLIEINKRIEYLLRRIKKLTAVANAAKDIHHDTECGSSSDGRKCWCGAEKLQEALEEWEKK